MKRKFKNYLKLGIFLFGISLLLVNCEKEEIIEEVQQEKKITHISFSDFKQNVNKNGDFERFNNHFDVVKNATNGQVFQRGLDSTSNATILTDRIVMIQEEDYTTYTFAISTEVEGNEFYNLVLYVNNQEEITESHILEYNPISENQEQFEGTINISNNNLFEVDNLLQLRGDDLCVIGSSERWECYYGKNHSPFESTGGSSCGGPIYSYDLIITLQYAPCPYGTSDFEYNVGGEVLDDGNDSGGGGTVPANNANTIITAPLLMDGTCPPGFEMDINGICVEIIPCTGGKIRDLTTGICECPLGKIENSEGVCIDDPCNKITYFLYTNEVDNPTNSFRQKLITLKTMTTDTVEHSISVFKDGTETELSGAGLSNGIEIPYIVPSAYTIYAHTHDSLGDGDGTFSVFSMQDLLVYATLIHNNSMDGTFVAYLTTDDDTEYALTIEEPTKLVDLFYSELVGIPPTLQGFIKKNNSRNKLETIDEKYFNSKNSDAKIKVDSTDPANDLKEFLKLMGEADAGMTLFECNDDFAEFKKVSLNSTDEIVRTPCN